jgi:outer membrane protein TolC
MDTPFPHPSRALKGRLLGCLFGLIWFGSLNQIHAQLQLPVPTPPKDRPESKVGGKNDRPNAEVAPEGNGKNAGGEKKEDAGAQSPPSTLPSALAAPRTLTIEQCIQIAHERSPILKSLRIRVESALLGQKGIEKTSRIIHSLISPDLPFRKEQAANGIAATHAELMQAEHDVKFNVVRTYYSAVYAREQLKLTSEIEKTLKEYLTFVKEAVAEGSVRELGKTQEEIFVQYVAQAVDKRIQAESGYKRAMEGLRHEMSFGDDFRFAPADEVLPDVDAEVDAELAVALALHRRGEIALAGIGVNVLELEVSAQGAPRFRLQQSTAAAASDVHSKTVPLGSRDGEYRPDAIAPDFPTLIVGDRKIRAERATALLRGQETLLEKTRDLVRLETMNAVIRFEAEKKRVPELKVAADAGTASVERARKDANGKPIKTDILTLEGLAAQSRGSYNEARYQRLLALAALERATAGGIKLNYRGQQ